MIFRFFYNLVLLVGVIVFLPLLFVKTILTPKYRGRVLGRLGCGPRLSLPPASVPRRPRIWLHALSVGEVSSAKNLVRAMRASLPEAALFFSAATRSGEEYARQTLAGAVDAFVPYPLDLPYAVKKIINGVAPDLFILIETDFWPNFLWELEKRGVPAILANGRISAGSFGRYQKLRWFFLPLFRSFRAITMQTAADGANLVRLGVPEQKIRVAGNLKYDAAPPPLPEGEGIAARARLAIPPGAFVWLAGSTHPGEEEIVLRVFRRLRPQYPELFLLLAPRNIERAAGVVKMAAELGAGQPFLRSAAPAQRGTIMVLDTFGELAGLYGICDLAFVGGSLVPAGGHNPLEPAFFGKPVIVGPHLDDFREIGRDLLLAGGAVMAHSEEELFASLRSLLADPKLRRTVGESGRKMVAAQLGATARHLEIIRAILAQGALV